MKIWTLFFVTISAVAFSQTKELKKDLKTDIEDMIPSQKSLNTIPLKNKKQNLFQSNDSELKNNVNQLIQNDSGFNSLIKINNTLYNTQFESVSNSVLFIESPSKNLTIKIN